MILQKSCSLEMQNVGCHSKESRALFDQLCSSSEEVKGCKGMFPLVLSPSKIFPAEDTLREKLKP